MVSIYTLVDSPQDYKFNTKSNEGGWYFLNVAAVMINYQHTDKLKAFFSKTIQ